MDLVKGFKSNEVKPVPPSNDKPTMTNRILPKRDFEKVLEHDRIYLGILHEILEFSVIEQDILGKKAQEVLTNQTKEKIEQNIGTLRKWAETKLKCLDIKAKIVIQEKLVNDKTEHFNKVFLKQWEKEKEETLKNFDEYEKKARTILKTKPKGSEKVLDKIEAELYWFDALEEGQKTDAEYMLNLYKPLKRLVNEYEKQTTKKQSV